MTTVTFEDVLAAERVVHRWLAKTPLYECTALSRLFGCHYWVKHENHLPVGAFKVRGGVNLVESLSPDEKRCGIIAVSTGNHGQSLAWACRNAAVPCTIVVPQQSNPGKLRAICDLGAKVTKHGADFDAAKQHCERIARVEASPQVAQTANGPPRYVHSANEPLLIAGVGTSTLEIFERVPEPDVILVPIGLGSGICGAAIVTKHLRPATRVIGVQAEGASAVTESWRSGTMVSKDQIDTRAEGLATREPAELTMQIMRELVDDIVLLSESEIDQAVRWLLEATHNLAEGAGAAATAAAWKIRDTLQGQTVVGVLSGGNLDLRILPDILEHTEPLPTHG